MLLVSNPKTMIARTNVKEFPRYFLLGVSGLALNVLNPCQVDVCVRLRVVQIHYLEGAVQFSQHHLWKRLSCLHCAGKLWILFPEEKAPLPKHNVVAKFKCF